MMAIIMAIMTIAVIIVSVTFTDAVKDFFTIMQTNYLTKIYCYYYCFHCYLHSTEKAAVLFIIIIIAVAMMILTVIS